MSDFHLIHDGGTEHKHSLDCFCCPILVGHIGMSAVVIHRTEDDSKWDWIKLKEKAMKMVSDVLALN